MWNVMYSWYFVNLCDQFRPYTNSGIHMTCNDLLIKKFKSSFSQHSHKMDLLTCLLYWRIISFINMFFLIHLAKGHVSFGHHLASVICHTSINHLKLVQKSSPLKSLDQFKLKLDWIILMVSDCKNVSNDPINLPTWLLLLLINIEVKSFYIRNYLSKMVIKSRKFPIMLFGHKTINNPNIKL